MRKVLAVLAVFVLLQVKPLHPQAPAQTGNHAANAQAQQKMEPSPPVVVKVDNYVTCDECQKKDTVSPIHPDQYTIWGFRLNLVLTGITLLIAVASFLQAKAANKQASHIVASERPWILVKKVIGPKDWWNPDDPAYTAGAVMQFAVYGNTPARMTGASFEIKRVPTKSVYPLIPDLPEEPVYPAQSDGAEIPENGRMLPPRDRFSVDLILNPPLLNEQEWHDLWDRKVCICVYGYIRYTDAFDRKHETRVCYVYEIGPGIITAHDGTRLNPDRFKIGGPCAYNQAT